MKGFANPPWNLVQRVLAKTQNQGAEVILVAPVWKSQPWLSPPTVITSRLATPATQAGHGNRVSPNNAPTSRVEHLRERLDEQGLSSQATDLILNSWRTKTNKSSDSFRAMESLVY